MRKRVIIIFYKQRRVQSYSPAVDVVVVASVVVVIVVVVVNVTASATAVDLIDDDCVESIVDLRCSLSEALSAFVVAVAVVFLFFV